MRLKEVTKNWLREFAGEKIFQRGNDYYHSGMVYEMEYYPETSRLHAKVSGNYGDYEVSISEEKHQLSCDCDCPYEGYPCKHVVAVLVSYIENKEGHFKKAKQRNNFWVSLKEELSQYSNDELIKIIVEAAQQFPDFKRALMMLVEPESPETLDFFCNQIRHIRLDDFDDDYGSDLEKIREFKKVLKAVDHANSEIKAEINWEVADKILDFLNQYGVSDERWEDLVLQTFENLEKVFLNSPELAEKRKDIVEQLQKYYDWGNCGMCDDISDLIERLEIN